MGLIGNNLRCKLIGFSFLGLILILIICRLWKKGVIGDWLMVIGEKGK